MAWTPVQTNHGGGAAQGNLTVNWPATPAPGNLLLALQACAYSALPVAPTGFTLIDRSQIAVGGQYVGWWYRIADGTEASVGFTATAAAADYGQIHEFSGSDPFSVLDQHTLTDTGVGHTSGTAGPITPTRNNELVVAWAGSNTGMGAFVSAGSGFSHIGTDEARIITADLVQTAAAAASTLITWTSSIRAYMLIASFFAPSRPMRPLIVPSQAPIRAALR